MRLESINSENNSMDNYYADDVFDRLIDSFRFLLFQDD
jgi:hypothetical protein